MTKPTTTLAALLATSLAWAAPAVAQPASAQPASVQPASVQPASAQPASAQPASVQRGPGMAGPAMVASAPMGGGGGAMAPVDRAMMRDMARMNRNMSAAPMTGDADRDFVAMMIPHHEGAVAMARSEQRFGHDPSLLRLAREIVAAQDRELALMRRWQAAHPQP